MALNPTKWKLNKAEQKEVDDAANEYYENLIAGGTDQKEAQEKKDEFHKTKTLEMKSAKSAKSAAKKAAATSNQDSSNGKKATPGAKTSKGGSGSQGQTNSDYLAAVQEAKNTILQTEVFKRIEAENPLPIKDKDGGVQVRCCVFCMELC